MQKDMSQGASPGALSIPPHARAGVPTSLSICQGSGGLSTRARAGPAPRFAAEVARAEGCSWPGPHGPDPQGHSTAHQIPKSKSETPPRSSQMQEDTELSCYSQGALPGSKLLN